MKKRIPRKTKKNFKAIQPLVLVFYVNVGNMDGQDVNEYLDKIKNVITLNKEQTKCFFVAVRDQETRIECINPVRIDNNLYKIATQKLEEAQQKFDEIIKKLGEKNGTI